MEKIENEIGKYGVLKLIIDPITLIASIKSSTLVGIAAGLIMLMIEGNDYLMNELKSGRINTVQKFFTEAERQNTTIVIQDTVNITAAMDLQYSQTFQTATTNKTSVSMRMSDNDLNSIILVGNKNFGIIKYMINGDIDEVSKMIKSSLKYNYPVIFPWNW
ncbi:MAG: hypothetical protein LBF12_07695 [Christensenellaceae bacterium]|jgi:hypothetical protein|nr:hypothetical protein [Christensenellaceae bacterium]